MISAAVFGLGVIGYGYRAVTLRSEMVMKKRMRKFEKRIDAARTSSSLRRVQLDIEKADEKRMLPVGGFGDLMSMIELRAEDLGLADFLPKESLVSAASGVSDDDFREGMDAMHDAKEEMSSVAMTPFGGPEAMRRMLQSYGLIPEGDGYDWSKVLDDPATNFVFRTH